MADEGMGFCVFNNAVVAARQAQRVHGAARVFILDWDVHHGNGTQAAFWADPSVLFISVHQDDLYPAGWGAADQVGIGEGEGFTVNVPLPAGTGNRGYAEAFATIVVPIARQFDPGPDHRLSRPGCERLRSTGANVIDAGRVPGDDGSDDGGGRGMLRRATGDHPGGWVCAALCALLLGNDRPDAGRLPPDGEWIADPYGERAETQPASVELSLDAARAIERVLADPATLLGDLTLGA